MPLPQLMSSGIELALNKLLALDPDSVQRIQKLSGKRLKVKVTELPWPLLFNFSDRVDVGIEMPSDMADAEHSNTDCSIELSLETLPKLQDTSQLTQLIQQKKLNLIGDMYIAQTFSSLLKDLDIDWEEQLAQYTGDIVAHQTFSTAKQMFAQLQQQWTQASASAASKLSQQNGLAVSNNEFFVFSDDVSALRSQAERLNARLALLEQRLSPSDSNKTDDHQQ